MNLRATEITIAFYKEDILLHKPGILYSFSVLNMSARFSLHINYGENPNKIYYYYLISKNNLHTLLEL